MVEYANLGMDKQLNHIVFAGSHDAGITEGGVNAKTQSLDLMGQANAGVRIFDLRIAAFTSGGVAGGVKRAELKAFHGPKTSANKTRNVAGNNVNIKRSKMKAGTTGLGLEDMLVDARNFVTQNNQEFLILKFHNSCSNESLIADTCINVLGNTIYTANAGMINTRTLGELAGKVIVVFEKRPGGYLGRNGIFQIKNLYKRDDTFLDVYDGIQYIGKGGTSAFNGKSTQNKIAENQEKQTKIMKRAAQGGRVKLKTSSWYNRKTDLAGRDPRVLGMMYWTTTGLRASIHDRDAEMWTGVDQDPVTRNNSPVLRALKETWAAGVREAVGADGNAYVHEMLQFMPNIVMIDFAETHRCQTIYELNFTTVNDIRAMANAG